MKTINEVKELVQKAEQIKKGTTSNYLAYQRQLNEQKRAIRADRELSGLGQMKKIELLQARETATLLKEAKEMRAAYNEMLTKARSAADDIYHAKTPKPDAVKQERFTNKLAELKTEILLSNTKKGTEKLKDFLASIDEPAFYEQTKAQFFELATPILSNAGSDADKTRLELSDMFEQAKVKALPAEALDAAQIAEYAGALQGGEFWSMLLKDKIGEDLGPTAKQYLNKPDQYFVDNPEAEKLIGKGGLDSEAYILAEAEIYES